MKLFPKLEYFAGILRITNPKSLEKWKDDGRYNKIINEGYIYAIGCGRFRHKICTCCKCRKFKSSIV